MSNLFSLVVLAVMMAGCGIADKKEAVKYNDAIIAETDALNMGYIEISQAMINSDYTKAKERLAMVESDCNNAVKHIKELGPFKGDTSFQQAALVYVWDLKGLAENEVKKLINNRHDADQMRMEYMEGARELDLVNDSIGELIRYKDSVASVNFITAQKNFAAKFGIQLLENPDQKKIDDIHNKLESQ